jgi:RHS repeat-associated protein
MLRFFRNFFRAISHFLKNLFSKSRPTPPSQMPPSIRFISPLSDLITDYVLIEYELIDQNSLATDIIIRFSIAGNTSQMATAYSSDPQHEGSHALSTNPSGIKHSFVWDWQADTSGSSINDVVFYLEAQNTNGRSSIINSGPVKISKLVASPSLTAPKVVINSPINDVQANDLLIDYTISDQQSDFADIEVLYSHNGSSFLPASPKGLDPRHSGNRGLLTSATGIDYTYVWNWQNDISQDPAINVQIKIIASDLSGNGQDVISNIIKIEKPLIIPSPVNIPPQVTIIGPYANIAATNILIDYRLTDPDANPASVSVEFSVNGTNFSAATAIVADPRHDGITHLTTSDNGINHRFIWDWQQDILTASALGVVLKITGSNQHGTGVAELSNSFDILSASPPPPPTDIRPVVKIVEPSLAKVIGSEVLITFDIFDPDNDPVDIIVDYSIGEAYKTASPISQDPRHSGLSGLSTSAAGEQHSFVWDWPIDINQDEVTNVTIRILVGDSQGYGNPVTTMPFTIFKNPPSIPGPSQVPEIFVLTPYEDIEQATEVPILFRCLDETSEAVDVEFFYSVDGAAFSALTAKTTDPRHGGNTGLATIPEGETHTFIWDYQADISSLTNSYIQLEAKAKNSRGTSQSGLSRFFTMLQTLSPPVTGVNQLTVNIQNTTNAITGNDHLIEYTVLEPNFENADVEILYSVAGGNFEPATPITGDSRQSGAAGLATSPDGEDYGFVWDWLTDIGSNQVSDVVIQVKVTISSGLSVTSQTSPVDISVMHHDYQFTVLSGNNIEACPSLRLPNGTIQLELKDYGSKVPLAEISVHVTEGGGGFPEQRPPADEQLRSHIHLTSDINGKITIPEFILGSKPSANRLLVQSDHCQISINILGTFANTQLLAIEPASGEIKDVVTVVRTLCAQLQDSNYPMARIDDTAIAIEMTDGGGFLRMDEGFGRSLVIETADNFLVSTNSTVKSSILFSCMLSSRVETTKVNLSLRDYPNGLKRSFTLETKKLHTLSYRSGTIGDENLDRISTNFLSIVSRWGTTDHDTATSGSPTVPVYGPFQMLAESNQGQSELFPEHRSGWAGNTTLMIRPLTAGQTSWKLKLPDFPDDNEHLLSGTAVDRLSGTSLYRSNPPWYIMMQNGGSRDDDNGIELQLVSGDMQYVGPNASAAQPWRVNVVTKALQPSDKRRLKAVKIYVKVRTSPLSSEIDDPNYAGVKAGIVGLSPGSGLDQLEIAVPHAPGVKPQTFYFTSRETNFDNYLELTAKVTVEEKDSNDIWQTYNRSSTVIARAMFFAPRFSVTQKRGSDFLEPGEESIIPTAVVDASGNSITANPDHEYYIEMRAQDYGSDVDISLPGRGPLKLMKVETNEKYTLYRSLPIVFYGENPNAFGQYQFNLPASHEYIRLSTPRWFYINGRDAIANNTERLNYWSPLRPYTFLNITTVNRSPLNPMVPKPRIHLENIIKNDPENAVILESNKVKLQITGKIYDTIADLCPGDTANIEKLYVNDIDYTVNSITETATIFRPHAWRGDFDINVPLEPGIQVLEIKVVNKLNEETIIQLLVDLIDSRNDYEHPDISKMKATVQLLTDPIISDQSGLVSINYRMPCSRQLMSIPPSVSVTINSIEKAPAVSIEDTSTLLLKSARAKENIFSSVILAVPDTVDQQKYDLLKNAGAAVIKHKKGNRLHIVGNSLPHIRGSVSLQNFISSEESEIRVLLKKLDGSFEERDEIKVNDEFTIEFRQLGAFSYSPVQLVIGTCDRLGQILEGNDRLLMIEADTGPNSGWLRMKSYINQSGNLVNSETIKICSEHGTSPQQSIGILRIHSHGSLRIGEFLGKKIKKMWPILNNPIRQKINDKQIAPEPNHGQGSRDGAINSVIVATGEMALNETDLMLYSRNMDVAFERIYLSYNDYDGPMGITWNHSYNTWFTKLDENTYEWISARGISYAFKKDITTGEFKSPNSVFAKLSILNQSTCVLEWFGGIKQIFIQIGLSSNVWVLHTIYDRSFNQVRSIHNQNGLLSSVKNCIKQKILFRYGDNSKLKIASDETGRALKYEYHDASSQYGPEGNLKSIRTPIVTSQHNKFSDGKKRHYDYFNDSSNPLIHNKLKAIQDGEGALRRSGSNPISPVLVNEVSTEGKIEKQHFGRGTFTFTYGQNTTTVSNRRNYLTEYLFASSIVDLHINTLAIEVKNPVLTGTELFKYAYNEHGNLIRYETPLDTKIEYRYETTGQDPRNYRNVLEKRHYPRQGRSDKLINTVGITDFTANPPETSPAVLIWKWTYETKFQKVKTMEDPLGQISSYMYDYETNDIPQNHGNLYQLTEQTVRSGKHSQASANRISKWHYNNFGQEVKNISANGVITRYEYYPDNNFTDGQLITDAETTTSHLAKIIYDDSDPSITRSALLTALATSSETIKYDKWGNISSNTDKNGNTVLTKYNELGQIIERRSPEGLVEQFWYNLNNQQIKSSKLVKDLNFPRLSRKERSKVVLLEFEYDRTGNIITEIADRGGLNLKTSFEYDEEDNLIRVISPKANRSNNPDINNYVEYEYDPQNRKIKMIQSPNISPRWEKEIDYDEEGNVLITSETMSTTASGSLVMSYEYNNWGQQIASVDAYGNKKIQLYDALGQITYMARAGSVDGEYPISQSRILNEAIIFLNETGNTVARQTKVFQWKKQGSNWQIENIETGKMITSQEYDEVGNVVSTIEANGHRTEHRYDAYGNPVATASSGNGESRARYDSMGNVLSASIPSPSGPNEIILLRTYDKEDRIITNHETGKEKEYSYFDSMGQLRLKIDGKGNRVYQEYDNIGRLIKIRREIRKGGRYQSSSSPSPHSLESEMIMTYEFDENDNAISIKDSKNNNILSHEYDSRNERIRTNLPNDAFSLLQRAATGNNVYQFSYWENSRIKDMTSPDGLIIHHNYDDAGRLKERTVTGPASALHGSTKQEYKHDGANRCIYSSDNNGLLNKKIEIEHRYNSLNEIYSDRQKQNIISNHQDLIAEAKFRANGEFALIQFPGNSVPNTRYIYNGSGRLSSIHDNLTKEKLIDINYNKHYVSDRVIVNNHREVVQHNSQGVVERFMHFSTVAGTDSPSATVPGLNSNEKVVSAEEFVFNDTGYPYIVKNLKENKASLNFYDSLGRLKTVLADIDADDLNSKPNFGKWQHYDSHGNTIISSEGQIIKETSDAYITNNSTDFLRTYNLANQVGRTVESYVKNGLNQESMNIYYDRRGNMIRDHQYDYKYDAFNRLVTILDKNSQRIIVQNYYDSFDRRIVKNNLRYLYYKNKIIEERFLWIKRFLHDENGVFMIEDDTTATGGIRWRRYIHRDRTGNAIYMTNRSGDIIEKYVHHPLTGVPSVLDANDEEKTIGSGNPFLFQGMFYDDEVQLYVTGPRFYHPKFKMMMQRDPEGIDFDSNAYTFARNNPNSFTDPTGRTPFLVILMVTGFFLGAGLMAVRQFMLYLDGEKNAFNPWEILVAGLFGAVMAPIAFIAPELVGLSFGVIGAFSAVDEYEQGHYWTASFDAIFAVLAIGGAVKGGTLVRAVHRHRLGPKAFDRFYAQKLSSKDKISLLGKSRDQVQERYAQLERGNADRYFFHLIQRVDNMARKIGVSPDDITFVWSMINRSRMKGHPRVSSQTANAQQGMREMGGGYVNDRFYIELDYFLPRHVQARLTGIGSNVPRNIASVRGRYPTIEALFLHEVGHRLQKPATGHGGGLYKDPSSLSIFHFYIRQNIISKSMALQVAKGIRHEPG